MTSMFENITKRLSVLIVLRILPLEAFYSWPGE